MTLLQASRTLVKSPPELWAELSDVGTLARHLGEFGEIRITKSDPEARVEWEADRASGTVWLEPTGWGTRVVLTVDTPEEETGKIAALAEDPVTVAPAEPRRGFFARLFRRAPEPPEPEPVVPEPEPPAATAEPEPEGPSREEAHAVLTSVLDTLGAAHHRPFSRP